MNPCVPVCPGCRSLPRRTASGAGGSRIGKTSTRIGIPPTRSPVVSWHSAHSSRYRHSRPKPWHEPSSSSLAPRDDHWKSGQWFPQTVNLPADAGPVTSGTRACVSNAGSLVGSLLEGIWDALSALMAFEDMTNGPVTVRWIWVPRLQVATQIASLRACSGKICDKVGWLYLFPPLRFASTRTRSSCLAWMLTSRVGRLPPHRLARRPPPPRRRRDKAADQDECAS